MTGTSANAPVKDERSQYSLKGYHVRGESARSSHDDERGSDPAGANSGRSNAHDGATA